MCTPTTIGIFSISGCGMSVWVSKRVGAQAASATVAAVATSDARTRRVAPWRRGECRRLCM